MGAYLITPAMGSHFVMYLAKMQVNFMHLKNTRPTESSSSLLSRYSYAKFSLWSHDFSFLPLAVRCFVMPYLEDVERLIHMHTYLLILSILVRCETSPTIVVFERRYVNLRNLVPKQIVGSTAMQPLLDTPK
ncbi:hypothetical protein IFM89_012968 [Coptis chinensis]|uniref:Uncharacterized protein n=1 Tax=Coptis chinensis TaxID=261450 RepID=A0A835HV75_9MAGN|nr:hypothetical protein IFM89_012968 [Coptis chinensis]